MNFSLTILATSFTLVGSLFLAACAGEDASQVVAEDAVVADLQVPPVAASDDALATFLRGGDFHFALQDSAVFAAVTKHCQDDAAGANAAAREAEASACVAKVQEQADGEGVEITALEGGRVRYLSYFTTNGRRQVHLLAEMSAVAAEKGMVALTDIKSLEGPELPPGARVLVEVVGRDTIAMDKDPSGHPRTGGRRLVYHLDAR